MHRIRASISIVCSRVLAIKMWKRSNVFATIFGACVIKVNELEHIECIVIVRKTKYHLFPHILVPTGVVTFARRCVSVENLPKWDECQATFADSLLHVSNDGTIEDDGEGLLQVDFANKFLGGGVLNYGCVQEEIRFMICPELLVSRLFTEYLWENECMTIVGCEQFNCYQGYASTFMWTGDMLDQTPYDSSQRRKCAIVAIDAIPFRNKTQQYKEDMLKRELNKVCQMSHYLKNNGRRKYFVIDFMWTLIF